MRVRTFARVFYVLFWCVCVFAGVHEEGAAKSGAAAEGRGSETARGSSYLHPTPPRQGKKTRSITQSINQSITYLGRR